MNAQPEARYLTYFFCDLVGSTELTRQDDDPEAAFDLIHRFQRGCAEIIEQHQGYVARFMGDAVLAYFGYPAASDTSAEASLRAALAVRAWVHTLDARLAVRTGIANGRGILAELKKSDGSSEMSVVSDATNFAARLEACAHPGEILVSVKIHDQVVGLFDFEPARVEVFKGYEEPQTVYAVRRLGDFLSRSQRLDEQGGERCVGREAEFAEIAALWQQASETAGKSLLVRGEAGIGKTTLLREVRARHVARTLKLFPSQFEQATALFPVRTLFEPLWQDDDDSALRAWLDSLLGQEQSPDHYLVVGRLLGRIAAPALPPNVLREQILTGLTRLLLAIGRANPTLIFVEDLHWLDGTTLALLGRVSQQRADSHLFLIATTRPEADVSTLAWDRVLDLQALDAVLASDLLDGMDEAGSLSPALRQRIVEKAGGVPLLVTEFARAALASLQTTAFAELLVPENLLQSYLARIDGWRVQRPVIDVAAAIGHGFDARLLAQTLGLPQAEVVATLDTLASHALLVAYETAQGRAYNFSHALLGEAAYSTLLRKQRHALHQRILDAWSVLDPQFEHSHPEQAARHLEGVGQYSSASAVLLGASQARFAAAQFAETEALLGRALVLLPKLEDVTHRTVLAVQLHALLGLTYTMLRGYTDPRVNQVSTEVLTLCAALPERGLNEYLALAGIVGYKFTTGDFRGADDVTRQMARIASQIGSPVHINLASATASSVCFAIADFAGARQHAQAVLDTYTSDNIRKDLELGAMDPKVQVHLFNSHVEAMQGDLAAAAREREQAIRHSDLLGLVQIKPYAGVYGYASASYFNPPASLIESYQREIAFANEFGMAFWAMGGVCWMGIAMQSLGLHEEALATLEHGLGLADLFGMRYTIPFMRSRQADTLARLGRLDEARAMVSKSLADTHAAGERWAEPDILRVEAGILLRAGERDAARACFIQALERAREQSSLGWEILIVRSLCEHDVLDWMPPPTREDLRQRFAASAAAQQDWTQDVRSVL